MAIVAVTTSPATLDSGSSEFVTVTNTGTVDVTVVRGSQSFTLRPTQGRTVYPEGSAVTASVVSGSGQVTTAAQAAQVTQAQQLAANTAAIAGLPGTYVPQRAALRYDPTAKSSGALAASLTADTGHAMTAFASPTNAAPLTISSGVITNTTSGGGTSAGYLQADLGGRVRRVGAMVSWPTNALGVFAVVIPSAPWSSGVLPNAGFHLSINGNGIWTLLRFSTGGSTTIASSTTHGRWQTAWGTGLQPFDFYLDPDNNKAVLCWPDGTSTVVTSAFLGSDTSNYAIWELFANTGGTDVSASLGLLWADTLPVSADVSALTPYRLPTRVNPPVSYNASGALTVDASKTSFHEVTLTGNLTALTLSGASYKGQTVHVELVQDATGTRTLSGAAATLKWAGATAPTLSTTAARRDIFRFRFDGNNYLEVSRSMNVG